MKEAALAYAAKGWPVLPCEPGGKAPLGRLVPNGLKNATTLESAIRGWWSAEPDANIGLVTGVAFDVLDVDSNEALEELRRRAPFWLAGSGYAVLTPRGYHFYYLPTGKGNRAGLAGIKGVDWRGAGGYVVAPPSETDRGQYEQVGGRIADITDDILTLFDVREYTNSEHPGPPTAERYAQAALEGEVGRVVLAEEGTRNHTLNRAAFALGQLVGSGDLDSQVVGDTLLYAAELNGLGAEEARRTIASGMRSGIEQPRGER